MAALLGWVVWTVIAGAFLAACLGGLYLQFDGLRRLRNGVRFYRNEGCAVGDLDDLPPGFDPANATQPREYVERRIEPGDRVRVVGRLDGDRVVPAEDGTEQVVRDGDPETDLGPAVATLAGVLVSFVLVGTLLLVTGLVWVLGIYRP